MVVGPAQFGAFKDFHVVVHPDRESTDFVHHNEVWFTYTGDDGAPYEAVAIGIGDGKGNAVLVQITANPPLDVTLIDKIVTSIVILHPAPSTPSPAS
jgi:hypothetical protein